MNDAPPFRVEDASRAARTGFTLVECLVVIAILGLLTAILVPAVMSARRAALKAQCVNNLRQLGIGLANYASTFDTLPPANVNGNSFLVAILPFIEEKPLYHAINFRWPASGAVANSTVTSAMIGAYLCPADERYPVELGDWGWTSYAGNGGLGVQDPGENGAFGPWNAIVRFSEFIDGTSRTALTAEWRLGPYESDDRDPRRAVFLAFAAPGKAAELDRFAEACHEVDVATAKLARRRQGMNWTKGGRFGCALYNHTVGPNDHSCDGGGRQEGAWTAGSWHSGGANMLFADSSTRFIRDTVSLAVWRALGSRNGGEAVSDDAF